MKHSDDDGARLLTTREIEIARLVARGKRNIEIAGDLTLSVLTVQSHLHHIYIKLGLRSRTELGHWVSQHDAKDT